MKFIIVFSCLLALAMSHDSSESEEEEKLEALHDKCQADPKTHADDALLADLPKNLKNPNVQAHLFCESQGIGLQDADGKLNIKEIKCKIRLSNKVEKYIDELTKDCAKQKKTPGETAAHLFWCLANHGVTFFHHFMHHKHHHGHGPHCGNKA